MKWSAKAILEYLQSQEVNSKEDYERIIKELELAATEAQANRVRNKEAKTEAKKGIKAKAQEMLALIELDHQEDTLLLKEAMNDPVGNSVRIADLINDLHYLKGKREGIEELIS